MKSHDTHGLDDRQAKPRVDKTDNDQDAYNGPASPRTPPRTSINHPKISTDPPRSSKDPKNLQGALKSFDEEYTSLLNAYEALAELQSLQGTSNLGIKQICVVGYQSVGKSTFLEALANNEISLPRGANMVTRSPIRLILRASSTYKCIIQGKDITAEFHPLSPKERGERIASEYQLALQNLGVSNAETCTDKEVKLEVFAPGIPNITLLDLPGVPTEKYMSQLDVVLRMHERFAKDKNCLIVVLDGLGIGDNSYIANKASNILQQADEEKRLVCVYNIQAGTTDFSELYSRLLERKKEGHPVYVVRLESHKERQQGIQNAAREEVSEWKQKILQRNMVICNEGRLADSDLEWAVGLLGVDSCQKYLAKRQKDLVLSSMRSTGLVTTVDQMLASEEAALQEFLAATCVDRSASDKLSEIEKYAGNLQSIVEAAVNLGKIPRVTPTKRGSSQKPLALGYDLYAIMPKANLAEKVYLRDAKSAAMSFMQDNVDDELYAAFRLQGGLAPKGVTQERTTLEVATSSAYDELHSLALSHVEELRKIVGDSVKNMIFDERATQNIVPDHLPNLIKFFQNATDEFFDAKKKELTKQIQFLMSCMKENMRWEENLAIPVGGQYEEILQDQHKKIKSLEDEIDNEMNEDRAQHQSGQNPPTSKPQGNAPPVPPRPRKEVGRQAESGTSQGDSLPERLANLGVTPPLNPAMGMSSSNPTTPPVPLGYVANLTTPPFPSPHANVPAIDDSYSRLKYNALLLLINTQEKFADMSLRATRMIQIQSTNREYTLSKQQEMRVLEAFLKKKARDQTDLDHLFAIPEEKEQQKFQMKKKIKCCEEFKKQFASLNNINFV